MNVILNIQSVEANQIKQIQKLNKLKVLQDCQQQIRQRDQKRQKMINRSQRLLMVIKVVTILTLFSISAQATDLEHFQFLDIFQNQKNIIDIQNANKTQQQYQNYVNIMYSDKNERFYYIYKFTGRGCEQILIQAKQININKMSTLIILKAENNTSKIVQQCSLDKKQECNIFLQQKIGTDDTFFMILFEELSNSIKSIAVKIQCRNTSIITSNQINKATTINSSNDIQYVFNKINSKINKQSSNFINEFMNAIPPNRYKLRGLQQKDKKTNDQQTSSQNDDKIIVVIILGVIGLVIIATIIYAKCMQYRNENLDEPEPLEEEGGEEEEQVNSNGEDKPSDGKARNKKKDQSSSPTKNQMDNNMKLKNKDQQMEIGFDEMCSTERKQRTNSNASYILNDISHNNLKHDKQKLLTKKTTDTGKKMINTGKNRKNNLRIVIEDSSFDNVKEQQKQSQLQKLQQQALKQQEQNKEKEQELLSQSKKLTVQEKPTEEEQDKQQLEINIKQNQQEEIQQPQVVESQQLDSLVVVPQQLDQQQQLVQFDEQQKEGDKEQQDSLSPQIN